MNRLTKTVEKKTFVQLVAIVFSLSLLMLIYFHLERFANYLLELLFGRSEHSPISESVYFLIYEIPKVFILLVTIVFFVGIIRSYFSPERTRAILGKNKVFIGNILSALLGTVTPFCSCSAIPLFLGFVQGGVPLGVTFSFLIAAPMVNEIALVLLLGLFGWKIAALYYVTGLLLAIISGLLIGVFSMEKYLQPWVLEHRGETENYHERIISMSERINFGLIAVKDIIAKVWLYLIFGIGVGAIIHGYVPQNFMASLMGKSIWWSVPVAVLLGIPMYSNAAGIIPIVQTLLAKGASIGTVLAFMMSVIGLSLPEVVILKKVLRWELIASFVGVVAFGIIIIGYIFNIIL